MVIEIPWDSPGSGQRFVLVVNSEPGSLIFTCMMLQRLGYHACSAISVVTALEIAKVTPPAIVIAELYLKAWEDSICSIFCAKTLLPALSPL
jgi:hypothetical protein